MNGRLVTRRLLPAILLIALVMRAGFLVRNWNNLEFDTAFLLHAEVARHLAEGHWLQYNEAAFNTYVADCRQAQRLIDPADYRFTPSAVLAPLYNDEGGYAMLLAGTWKLFGSQRWAYVRVLQLLLDVVMCWLVFLIGVRVFNERTGLGAAALYAVFIPGIEMAVRPHRDIWVSFLFISSVYLLVRNGWSRPMLRDLFLIGVTAGAVAWMRSTAVLFVFAVAAALLLVHGRNEPMRRIAVLLAGFLLLLVPLLVRNYLVFDKFMATRGAFWHSFWAGVGQTPNPYGLQDDDATIIAFAARSDSTAKIGGDKYEQVLKRKAQDVWRDHPGWYALSVAKRSTLFVFPKTGRAIFFQETLQQHVTGFLNRSIGTAFVLSIDVLFGVLFLVGVWMARHRWRSLLLLLIPFLYTVGTLAPFYVTGRNIANVYFTVLVLVAFAATELLERVSHILRTKTA
jgi:4-amino-4-deoxy-L-arabinose transferase-like glycosyltransferase